MKTAIIAAALLLATTAQAQRFSASDVPAARLRQPGRVVIRNSGATITAYRFFGDVREAIFSLRTSPASLRYIPFGPSVFDGNAAFTAPAKLSPVIGEASRTHGIDPRLVAAIARQESAFNPASVSRVGAGGIMQLMPATARFLGVSNVFDPRENVFGGARYLRTLLDTFHGDLDLTLAAYNAGPGAVQKYGGVPPYAETRQYVRRVRASYEASLAR